MANYLREAGSQFPSKTIKVSMLDKWGFDQFKDIDDDVKNVIKTYYDLLANGDIDLALMIKKNNAERLRQYWLDAEKINLILDEIQNVELYAYSARECVVSETEPEVDIAAGCYWIKPGYISDQVPVQ